VAEVVPVVDDGLGNSSYLLAVGEGRALVVDPARHPGAYLAAAERRGWDLAFAAETHLHADFVSGARELAAVGASLLAPAGAAQQFPVRGLADGEEVDLGGLSLRAMATPGHTPEHLAYLVLDDGRPVALFSGGALLAGSVARTDLIAPDQTEALARALWRSLHERILTLPDDVAVYPTHGAGSFCSSSAGGDRVTTIGREKRANPLLAAPDEDAFVKQLVSGLGTYPPYFLRLRDVNQRGPRLYGPGRPALPPLAPDLVRRLHAGGTWIIDARPIDAFAAGHLPGSVSIALRPQFSSWLGWIVPEDAPVVFVVAAGQDRSELVRQAHNVGYEQLLGELAGGVEAWQAAGHHLEETALLPAADVATTVVDVRQRSEYDAGHVPDAHHIELGSITEVDVPRGTLAVMCGHGERAMTAASLLARAGRADVTVLVGGPEDWARTHGRLVRQ
jgi:glyoxylase-like metal-dependent hydrolase (beta-lactamase superfamily II)